MIEIYLRHRGPYALLLGRQIGPTTRNASGHTTDRARGPFNAEEAHEEARLLVNDPRDTVVDVHVFSETEQMFIGAAYRRGVTYPSYEELKEEYRGRMELAEQRADPASLQEREIPLPEMDAFINPSLPAPPDPVVPDLRNVLEKTQPVDRAKRAGDRFPAVRGRAIEIATRDGWPTARSAQIIKELLEARAPLTPAEIVQAVGAALNDLGVEHPKSLVSRLKQAGLLKEST